MAKSLENVRRVRVLPLDALPGHVFLQDRAWAQVKESQKIWRAHVFQFKENGCDPFLVLERPFLFSYSLAYLPHGLPQFSDISSLKILAQYLPKSFILRWDIPDEYDSLAVCQEREYSLKESGLFSAPSVQVPTTVVIDLRNDEDMLFSAMHTKTRYNIRLAMRKSVHVVQTERIDSWYTLHRLTAKRKRIAVHPIQYYKNVQKYIQKAGGRIYIYMAYVKQECVAGIFVLHWNKRASYLYGGSDIGWKSFMAPHLLQWHAIQYAKTCGMVEYDLMGIARSPQCDGSLQGIRRFKLGFGGHIRYRPGCWDLYLHQAKASLFCALERFRKRSHT